MKMSKKTNEMKKLPAIELRDIQEAAIPAILRVCGEESDPNLQDVPHRDISKHLHQRHWIKEWSPAKRWKSRDFIHVEGWSELRLAELRRKLDDPGDAFFDLVFPYQSTFFRVRTWVEVSECFLPGHGKIVNRIVREYNGLLGKGEIDSVEFLKSLNLGPPDSLLQCEMADQVILAVKNKAQKGQAGGSYESLIRDYGRGTLIIGLPLLFATLPPDPTNPSVVLTDFISRVILGFKAIERSVLRKNWCPFDSIVVLWNPFLESIASWVKVADPKFYSDPANLRWRSPISLLRGQSAFTSPSLPTSKSIEYRVRWNRYSSVNSLLSDQERLCRLFNQPRPIGPKACLDFNREGADRSPRLRSHSWLLHLWLFVHINGWRGLCRWILARFSMRRLFSHWRLSSRARKRYHASRIHHSV